MSRRQWYAVHTYSGHENKVKENLERRAESLNLGDRFFRVLVPTELEVTKKDGKRREIKRKIFPGYVLVEMILDESTWHLVRGTSGVTGFVSSGNNPIPLEPGEVEDILRALESPEAKPRVKWAVDEVIRVKDGPFTDFTGKIEEINVEKEKLKVLISIFGRDTPVELEFDQVEKID
jgi:transcriptional antiterminator NusG